jgi:DNA-binding response OmpR family regulator
MMPLLDGISLTQRIRRDDPNTPILILTAKTQTKDVVQGFHAGCNDYLRKPFGLEELVVRVWSLLGRHGKSDDLLQSFTIGNYTFQPRHQTLMLGSSLQHLTHRESEVLWLLVQNKGQVVQRSQLLLKVWGTDTFFAGRSMDVFVTKLRKRLSGDPAIQLLNIRGIGYKLVD